MFDEAAFWSSAEKIRFRFETLDGKSLYTVKLPKYKKYHFGGFLLYCVCFMMDFMDFNLWTSVQLFVLNLNERVSVFRISLINILQ